MVFFRRTPLVWISLLLVAFLTIFTWPISTLLAVFAHDIFQKGELGFGLLQSAFGLGAGVGAFGFYALYNKINRKDLLLITSLVIVLVSANVLALWHVWPLALVALFFIGWSVTAVIGLLNTVVQEIVPDELRGRMMSYYSFVLIGGMPLGALLASVGVNLVGASLTIVIS